MIVYVWERKLLTKTSGRARLSSSFSLADGRVFYAATRGRWVGVELDQPSPATSWRDTSSRTEEVSYVDLTPEYAA